MLRNRFLRNRFSYSSSDSTFTKTLRSENRIKSFETVSQKQIPIIACRFCRPVWVMAIVNRIYCLWESHLLLRNFEKDKSLWELERAVAWIWAIRWASASVFFNTRDHLLENTFSFWNRSWREKGDMHDYFMLLLIFAWRIEHKIPRRAIIQTWTNLRTFSDLNKIESKIQIEINLRTKFSGEKLDNKIRRRKTWELFRHFSKHTLKW